MYYTHSVIRYIDGKFIGSVHTDTQVGCQGFLANLLEQGFQGNVAIVESKVADAMEVAKFLDEGRFTYDYFLNGNKRKHERAECNVYSKYHGIPDYEFILLVSKYLNGKYNK